MRTGLRSPHRRSLRPLPCCSARSRRCAPTRSVDPEAVGLRRDARQRLRRLQRRARTRSAASAGSTSAPRSTRCRARRRRPTASSPTTTPAPRPQSLRQHAATATLDWWDDPNDVYRIISSRANACPCSCTLRPEVDPSMLLWKPGLHALADARSDLRARRSIHGPGVPERIRFQRAHGLVPLQVKLARPGFGPTASP